uniref:Uncharacterized protein n=1 Tax=Rhizophora mucronata TaxID=61149 RepID=A0A2P2PTE4_RHIMU
MTHPTKISHCPVPWKRILQTSGAA